MGSESRSRDERANHAENTKKGKREQIVLAMASHEFPLCLHLIFSLLLLIFSSSSAQPVQNISLGSSISTTDQNPYWVSPSGEFAFGFYSAKQGLILLAIWYEKIPAKTIVWTAKTDAPIEERSKLQLQMNGVASLTNTSGARIWKAESSSGADPVHSAAMLDTGNFVLQSNSSIFLWETFDQPTDTILPGQKLDRGAKLVSQNSDENGSPGTGRFQLSLELGGNLLLQAIARPTEGAYGQYWQSNTAGTNSRLVFNESGYMYLLDLNNGTLYSIASETPASTRDFYQRATLDFDGVFRKYRYPKSSSQINSGNVSWSVSWYGPEDICTSLIETVGSGACGFNSYCVIAEQDQKPKCECPPGYDYLDPSNKFRGCKQNFVLQNCKINSNDDDHDDSTRAEAGGFEMKELINVDWPLSDYEHFKSVNEDWCSNTCLRDCFCAVSIIRGEECWLKKIPLSNGKRDTSVGGKALVKVGNISSTSQPPVLPPPSQFSHEERKKDRDSRVLPMAIILSSSLFFNLLLLAVSLAAYVKQKKGAETKSARGTTDEGNLRCFTYEELEQATNGFREKLGSGSFSTVYKGNLGGVATGKLIAVKKLGKITQEVIDKEFKTEMKAIGQTNHKNLVGLLGFCDEGIHRLLVYEFMSNGSLANFLFENPIRRSWHQRVQIAFGIARGLAYLHEECCTQIIHCDIKPQNILIDASFTARISDFGLAKLLKTDQTQTNTYIRGTRGYVAPEWFKSGAITAKVDVYSFGIVLMEIIFCRKNVEKLEVGEEHPVVLSECVYESYFKSELHLLVGDDEEAKSDGMRLERMVMVAIWCVQDDPSLRPSMRKVTQMLEGAAEVSKPPDPFSMTSTVEVIC